MAFPPDLLVFERDAAFGAGLWRRVFATVWRDTPTAERLCSCGRFQDEVTRRCPDGFVAAATRMVATGMSLLNRRTPTRWFDSVQHAAGWVSTRVATIPAAQPVSASELVAAFAEL